MTQSNPGWRSEINICSSVEIHSHTERALGSLMSGWINISNRAFPLYAHLITKKERQEIDALIFVKSGK